MAYMHVIQCRTVRRKVSGIRDICLCYTGNENIGNKKDHQVEWKEIWDTVGV
jgi:hypothetical protein